MGRCRDEPVPSSPRQSANPPRSNWSTLKGSTLKGSTLMTRSSQRTSCPEPTGRTTSKEPERSTPVVRHSRSAPTRPRPTTSPQNRSAQPGPVPGSLRPSRQFASLTSVRNLFVMWEQPLPNFSPSLLFCLTFPANRRHQERSWCESPTTVTSQTSAGFGGESGWSPRSISHRRAPWPSAVTTDGL